MSVHPIVALRDAASTCGAPSLRGELEALVRAVRGASAFRARLTDVLHEELFTRREGLRSEEACALSYARMRHLRSALGLRAEVLLHDLDVLLALHELTGLVDGTLTTLLTIHYNLCTGSIARLGAGRAELDPLREELEHMSSIGVFLATELAYGNNVQALETEAVYEPTTRTFMLRTPNAGAQKFMPNTGAPGIAKLAVVMARLKVSGRDCGVYPFIVRIRDAHGELCRGVRVTALGEKPDYALDNAVTSFHDVELPFAHWLPGEHSRIDEQGRFESRIKQKRARFFQAMERVQIGKLCLSACTVALASAALELTISYASQRKTFGVIGGDVEIFRYRSVQQPIIEAVALTYACTFLLAHTKERVRADGDAPSVESTRRLALTKVLCSAGAIRTLTMCRERVGAQGMFSANRIVSYLIQVKGVVTAEGDNELLLIKSGRELMMGHAYELPDDLDGLGALPLVGSLDFLVHVLALRERRLVERLRASVKAAPRTRSMFDVYNDHVCQTIELAHAHAARLAVDAFMEAISRVEGDALRAILEQLLALFCLSECARVSGMLLAEGLVDREFVLGIDDERRRLVAALAPHARLLGQGFAIPDSLLAAPIGHDFMASYDFMPDEPSPRESSLCLRAPLGEHEAYEAG